MRETQMGIWNSFRGKLFSLIGVFLFGMIAMIVVSEWSISTVRINGTLYKQIDHANDANVELAPPSLLLTDSYLNLLLLVNENDPLRIRNAISDFQAAEARYNEASKKIRESMLVDATARKDLGEHCDPVAKKFFNDARQDVLKIYESSVIAKEQRDKATASVATTLRTAYTEHTAAAKKVQEKVANSIKDLESTATSSVSYWSWVLYITSAVVLVCGVIYGLFIARSIVRPTEHLLRQMQTMAHGGGDLTARIPVESNDELGQLSGYINQVIKNLHDLVVNVRESSLSLFTSTTEIAATSKEQESTMQNLGSSTNQIAAAVKEISATAIELSSTMNEVNDSGKQTGMLASSGRAGLDGMGQTMRRLNEGTSSIGAKLGVVREKANDINVVVTTITKVADQTNLLSINAAIEAEKAGEFGRGFLVVAREIRRLADQTAVATLDIENMVRQMQAAVSAGVMEMDKFTEEVRSGVQAVSSISGQMTQIIEQVQLLNNRFQAVNEGTSHQSAGARQINDAMIQLATAVQQSLASLKEFHSVTQSLRGSAETLKNQVSRFQVAG